MIALVTGSAGFVGRRMVAELLARGCSVVECDIDDRAGGIDCRELFRVDNTVYDLVVHAAARAPHRAAIDGQPETAVYNCALDAAMFEWVARTRQRRVLYLSSSAVYPASLQVGVPVRLAENHRVDGADGPPDVYGRVKLSGERMAEAVAAAGVPVHVVRPFSGYGEGQSEDFPFGAFMARAWRREDPFVVWGDGSQVRDWLHVDDLVRAALAVVDADERRPVNLCTGRGVSMLELARTVCGAVGHDPVYATRPDMPAGVAYRVGDPARMHRFHTPRVSLAEGVARAVASRRDHERALVPVRAEVDGRLRP